MWYYINLIPRKFGTSSPESGVRSPESGVWGWWRSSPKNKSTGRHSGGAQTAMISKNNNKVVKRPRTRQDQTGHTHTQDTVRAFLEPVRSGAGAGRGPHRSIHYAHSVTRRKGNESKGKPAEKKNKRIYFAKNKCRGTDRKKVVKGSTNPPGPECK